MNIEILFAFISKCEVCFKREKKGKEERSKTVKITDEGFGKKVYCFHVF